MPVLRAVSAVVGAIALVLAPVAPVAAAPVAALADHPIVDGGTCDAVATGGYCVYDAIDFALGAAVDVTIPASVTHLTAVVFGAGGAPGQNTSGDGGAGGMVAGTFDLTSGHELRLWMGWQPDDNTSAPGWASGGNGGVSDIGGGNGGAGGGASAVAYPGAAEPLIVAGGGGGAGGGATGTVGARAAGGGGGTGGLPANSGQTPDDEIPTHGSGGDGAGESGPDGSNGTGTLATGGGGGGGGGHHGGTAGGEGIIYEYCDMQGNCTDYFPGGGGGGGGSSWVSSDVREAVYATGLNAPGKIYLLGETGTITRYECDGDGMKLHAIEPGVGQYYAVVVGGGGDQGHNEDHTFGSGAVISGLMDVTGMSQIGVSVGCSATHDARGWWKAGQGGEADSDYARDGGDAGNASVLFGDGNSQLPLMVAGGGGGSGGDGGCNVTGNVCITSGGIGGSGGGGGGGFDYAGTNGDGWFSAGGDGGCAACNRSEQGALDQNGGNGTGTSDHGRGAGGGGGAGYPQGGHGGGGPGGDDGAGGGGGAGASWASASYVTEVYQRPFSQRGQNGFIVLIPMPTPTASVTIEKTVTGNAAQYGTGPFTAELDCPAISVTKVVTLTTTTPAVVDGITAGASCTVRETGTGGATVPAAPQTFTVEASGSTVTLDNQFETTSVQLTLHSSISAEDATAPVPASIPVDDHTVQLACTFNGHVVDLPSVPDGVVAFDLAASWDAAGSSVTVPSVPIGASCSVSETSGAAKPEASYTHGGTSSTDPVFDFEVVSDPADNAVSIDDAYPTAGLTVTKASGGTGDALPGPYGVGLACTYHGAEVALPSELAAFQVAMGASHDVPNLPVGITCETTETDGGLAVGVHYSPSQTMHIASGGSNQTITNVFDEAPLLVSVGVAGEGASWANGTFEGTVTCRDGADLVFTAPVSVGPHGGFVTFDDPLLVAGLDCSFDETASAGATSVQYWSGADATPQATPVSVTLEDGAAASLEVRNVFDVAPLAVAKAVTGDGAIFANTGYDVTVGACTFNGLTVDAQSGVPTVSLTLPRDGATRVMGSVVVGAECEVHETGSGGATTTSYAASNTPDSTPLDGGIALVVAASDAGSTTATITNDFALAGLSVTVTNIGGAAWAANTELAVDVACTFNGLPVGDIGPDGIAALRFAPDGTPIPNHGSVALGSLPVNAVCSAVESEDGGATTITYDPVGDGTRSGERTVSAQGSSIAITNTFEAGTFSVTKQLGGNNASAHAAEDFHFEVGCTFNGQRLGNPPSDPDRNSLFWLVGGATETFDLLPVGAVCSAEEWAGHDATQVLPGLRQTGVVAAVGTGVTFTNVFDVVPLTVRIVLSGDGAEQYGETITFRPEVHCWAENDRTHELPLPDGSVYALDAADNFSRTIEAPADAYCTIELDGRGLRATELHPSEPIVTRTAIDENVLEVGAEYRLAQFVVHAEAFGTNASTADFRYATECLWGELGAEPVAIATTDTADAAFELSNGQSRTITALDGSFCQVTQTDDAGALRVVVEGDPTVTVGATTASVVMGKVPTQHARFLNYLQGSLPVTGAELSALAPIALVLLGLGVAAAAIRRRTTSSRAPAPRPR